MRWKCCKHWTYCWGTRQVISCNTIHGIASYRQASAPTNRLWKHERLGVTCLVTGTAARLTPAFGHTNILPKSPAGRLVVGGRYYTNSRRADTMQAQDKQANPPLRCVQKGIPLTEQRGGLPSATYPNCLFFSFLEANFLHLGLPQHLHSRWRSLASPNANFVASLH